MRRLGHVQSMLHATINLGAQVDKGSNNMEPTKGFWGKIWNERDVQVMLVLSLTLQLFLLFAGNVRRRRRVGWLRFLVWVAYLAAYAVAVSAIGLFSQYEDKYKLRSPESSSEHLHTLTMPFLWAPFLLLHLGGPDTITAFSIEDNNLWMRQLLNLVFQLSLALYVFWKSYDLLDWQLLAIAVPLFVAGIIKYGERIWALKSGSRDGLDCHTKKERVRAHVSEEQVTPPPGDIVASRALSSMLSCRGLLVGGKVYHLSAKDWSAFTGCFSEPDDKLEFVLMELGMIYDMLHTKAMVLHSWTGNVFRCIALVAMMVAFVLFWVSQHLYAHRTTNADITYMLFVVAMCVEVYSIFLVIVSPWTRARSKKGAFLSWLSNKLSCQGLPSPSMGQFNLTDYSLSTKSRPESISKVLKALGLDKHWRNLWHVNHVEDKEMVDYIVGLFNFEHNPSGERSRQLELGESLKSLLTIPFEHVLFRLHIFTEMHLSTLADDGASFEIKVLAAQCRKLSNYLMYLMAVCPSMLPVSNAAQHLLPSFAEWVRLNHGNLQTKAHILQTYTNDVIVTSNEHRSPFEGQASLKCIKELWARLLIYAAGKCPMELHVRQLGDGLELITVVGSLLIHCGIGDAGWKALDLLAPPRAPDAPYDTEKEHVAVEERDSTIMVKKSDPLYAFEFFQMRSLQQSPHLNVEAWAAYELVLQQPPSQPESQPESQPSTSSESEQAEIKRPQFSKQWIDSSSRQVNSRSALETQQAVAHRKQDVTHRKQMGLRHRAVSVGFQPPEVQIPRALSLSGAVQPPQGQVPRALSF